MRLILIFLFATSAKLAFTQTPDTVIASAKYTLTHNYDTLNPHLNISENYILMLGKTTSLYKSLDREIQDSMIYANFRRTKFISPQSGQRFNDEQIFFNYKQNKTFTTTNSTVGKYYVERAFKSIAWKILPETKTINNLNCQKAEGDFHGRNFTVWFSTDLPFKAGPWKLIGLPGLIIEAIDNSNRIKFSLTSFQFITKPSEITFFNQKYEEITWDNYVKIAKSIEDDPKGYIKKRTGMTFTTSSNEPLSHFNPMRPKKSINFPLEALEFYMLK